MPRKLQLSPGLLAELERKYRLEEVIGAGGMGAVIRAWDLRLERRVAIKVKSVGDGGDSLTPERFLFEAKVMGRIDHPRLVKIYDLGQNESDIYLVCEYLPGGSLADRLEIHPFVEVLKACEIAVDVLEGLAVLHEQGIVHRDLKPENILFGEDGHARVADLGLAKGGDRDFQTRPGVILGSLHYMSPEHFHGKDVGVPADLYALGTVLFEMVAGRWPYIGDSEAETIQRRLTQPAPRLRELQERCPAWLDAVVAQLLERDPADRQSSAAEVIGVLRQGMKEPLPAVSGARGARSMTTAAPQRPRARSSGTREVSSVPRPASAPALDATQLAPSLRSEEPRKVKKARPPRRLKPVLAVLAAILVSMAFVALRPGAPSGELGLTLFDDRVNVSGQIKGPRDLHFLLVDSQGRVVSETEVHDPRRGVEVALSLGESAKNIDQSLIFRIKSGDEVLLEQPIPRLDGPWTFPGLGHFTLEGPAIAERSWEAAIEGLSKGGSPGAPVRVPGTFRDGAVHFEHDVNAGWSRGSLVEVVGWPAPGSPASRAPLRIGRLGLGGGRTLSARDELATWMSTHLGRGSKKGAGLDAILEEAFRKAFGHAAHPAIEASLKRQLAPGGASFETQVAVYLWLQPLLVLEAWAMDWGLKPPVSVSEITGTFVPLDRRACVRYQMQELHCLADFEQARGVFTEGLTLIARDSFVAKRFFVPEEPGRPPELVVYGDPANYRARAEVTLHEGEGKGRGERVGLRLSIMNHHRTVSLKCHFPELPSISFELTNPTNWGNIDNPTGPMTYEPDSWSWKNIPQHSIHYEFLFPRKLLPGALPSGLIMEYVRIPGLKRQADRYGFLWRAEWFDPPEKL